MRSPLKMYQFFIDQLEIAPKNSTKSEDGLWQNAIKCFLMDFTFLVLYLFQRVMPKGEKQNSSSEAIMGVTHSCYKALQ